jgi:hypothetical protein
MRDDARQIGEQFFLVQTASPFGTTRHRSVAMKKLGLMLAAFVVCGCSTAIAQTESAAISGRVVDNTGAVVVGAQVTATNIDMGTPSTTKTNGEGFYLLPGLKPGRYRIAIKKEGFRQIVKTEIELHVQDVVAENFKLDVGAVSEAITVTAEAATVNTRDGSVSTVIDQTYVKNMPLNGRSFQDLILLTPGVTTQTTQVNSTTVGVGQTGEFSVNGQRTEANYYTVDGVSANAGIGASTGDNPLGYSGPSGSVAASTALGTTQALVSVDDLQEFRIQSSTYSAEYGRNPGGQFAFQTKSGTNSWHGTAYDYVRNNFFDANNYFNNYHSLPQPPLHQNDFGGTLGGPLRVPHLYDGKDKTFFFFSYEGLRLLQPQPAAVVPVPDACMRGDAASCPIVSPSNGTICPTMNSFPDCVQRTPANAAVLPVVNAFPKPSPNDTTADPVNGVGHFIGSWGNPGSLDSLSVRLDQKIKDRTSLFFRFSDTSSDTSFLGFQGNPPSMSTTTSYVLRTYTGGATTLFSNRLSNEVRLNYTSNNQRSGDHMVATGGAVPANLGQITELGPDALTQVAFILGGNFMAVDTTKDQSAQRQWNLVETASFTTGRHQLRFGVDYRRLSPFVVPHPLKSV